MLPCRGSQCSVLRQQVRQGAKLLCHDGLCLVGDPMLFLAAESGNRFSASLLIPRCHAVKLFFWSHLVYDYEQVSFNSAAGLQLSACPCLMLGEGQLCALRHRDCLADWQTSCR